ncbi:MAG TPA: hypothetical protein VK465_04565, partial [Fibrobacteria bacterium]|nr:hypothetical protein [Fibrobacteria bacterium]
MSRAPRKPAASGSFVSKSSAGKLPAKRKGPTPEVLRETARKLVEGLNPEQKAAAIAPPGA